MRQIMKSVGVLLNLEIIPVFSQKEKGLQIKSAKSEPSLI